MAGAEYLKNLIKAHINGDHNKFRQIALQIAAKEASLGHGKVAKEIRELIDNVSPMLGQHTGNVPPELKISAKSNISDLLHSSYPKERLYDIVLLPKTESSIHRIIDEWRNRNNLESHGLHCKSKLLLIGPPGCGKTLSARVLAGELGLPLFVVKLEGLISRYLGETAVHLRNIFNAITNTNGIYLFDEFDSIGTNRGDQRDVGEIRRVLSTFLILLEGFIGNSIIIAATNHEHMLDKALFRRFDDVIEFPMPSEKSAEKLILNKLQCVEKENLNWNALAKETKGMSYAEISKAITESLKTSVLNKYKKIKQNVIIESILRRKEMNSSNKNKE